MDESKQSLDIYSAKLTFSKKKNRVRVSLRFREEGRPREMDFFGIDELKELSWVRYHSDRIAVCHRVNEEGTYSLNGIKSSESFSQQLEKLVYQTYEYFTTRKSK